MSTFGTGQPVVVGIDGSDLSTVALAWGVDEARRNSCPLRLVHAAGPRERMSGDTLLETAATRARTAAPELDVSSVLETGHTAEALLKHASDANLVVLGSRGRGGFSGLLVGSTSLQVAMHAPCPVVVIRLAGEDAPPGPSASRVVVGIDNSPASQRAIDFAFEQAHSRGIGLTAVLTYAGPDFDTTVSPTHEWEQAAEREKAVLAESLGNRSDQFPGINIVQKAEWGNPIAILMDESAGAELLVVGSHGRGGFGGMVLGSVSHALLHHAHCPVAVVRSR